MFVCVLLAKVPLNLTAKKLNIYHTYKLNTNLLQVYHNKLTTGLPQAYYRLITRLTTQFIYMSSNGSHGGFENFSFTDNFQTDYVPALHYLDFTQKKMRTPHTCFQ